MTAPPFETSKLLETSGVAHGFFNRAGGVSSGAFATLNASPGSNDEIDKVTENRRRCLTALGIADGRLVTTNQVHGHNIAVVEGPWVHGPEDADGLVTRTRGLALGVLAADCMPFLLLDADAQVIGVAHAGWRGALAGVLENVVAAMEGLGAARGQIMAALGPCLRQPNFEVGLDLVAEFERKYPESLRFFLPGKSENKRQLDLAGFGAWRLRQAGVSQIDDLKQCTRAADDRYFSYRALTANGGAQYGRNLSAIALV